MEREDIRIKNSERRRSFAKLLITISLLSLISYPLVNKYLPTFERVADCGLTYVKAGSSKIGDTLNTEFNLDIWRTQIGIGLGQIYYGIKYVCPNSKY